MLCGCKRETAREELKNSDKGAGQTSSFYVYAAIKLPGSSHAIIIIMIKFRYFE
jgi:hypothetical protein